MSNYRETHEIQVDLETFEGLLTGGDNVGRVIITCADRPTESIVYYTKVDYEDDGNEILNFE